MKLLIASDLHGSAFWTGRLIEKLKGDDYQALVLLGDILYHGPRNDLPEDYNPKAVIAMLSALTLPVVAVRGNCEAEVDQMVLPFNVSSDYGLIYDSARNLVMHLFHGHREAPKARAGEVVLSGHTHVPVMEEKGGVIFINPGSVSIPKNGSANSWMVYDDGIFSIFDMENNLIMQVQASGYGKVMKESANG